MIFEDFKEIYKNISKEDILKQFYFEHNDLKELNSANEVISKCSNEYKEKMIKYRDQRNELNKENYELKQIINKAIEYTETIQNKNYELLDILTGGEK